MSLKSDLNPPVIVAFYFLGGGLLSVIGCFFVHPAGGNEILDNTPFGDPFSFLLGGLVFFSVTSFLVSVVVWFVYRKSARQYWYLLLLVILFSLPLTIGLIRGLFE